MRRVITPVMLALAFAAFTSVDASAGLFGKIGGCDTNCCHAEPACGCEAPACGCAVEPACGFETNCCDSGCGIKRPGLLSRLFAKKHSHCCEAPCAEPACGCEVAAAPCCDSGCGIKRPGLLSRLFAKKACCDSGCAPAPTCGCEPTCGF